jgi:UDP-3-O-[3-hydroxymyristoyl] glucosamine N-acyltransferase
MPISLAQLATLVDGQLRVTKPSDEQMRITGAATLDVASAGQITLADHADRAAELGRSAAAAAIVSANVPSSEKPTIVVENVHHAFAQVVTHFRPLRQRPSQGISSAAHVSPTAQIAEDVEIYPGAHIGDQVVIGAGSVIHPGVTIMAGCQLGKQVTIFPNVVLYEDTLVGNRSIIHSGAVLGAYGFGYRQQEGHHRLSAQLGYVELGDDVEIGACATVDRGTYGPTVIGAGTKVDNLVQIAHNCRLGKHNLICGQVGIAGSTTTGDHVVMAGQVGVRDHVHIGSGAVLCSKAGISNNIEAKEVVLGQPAIPVRKQKLQLAAISKLPEMRKQFKALQRELTKLQAKLSPEETDEAGNASNNKAGDNSSEQAA